MKEAIEKAVATLASAHTDKRLGRFEVQVDACDAATVKLSGKVLESAQLQALLKEMPAGVKVDASAVQVLRKEQKTMRYVATTLTDLHREPSWISELMTQFTPGWPLEILEDGERWAFVRMADGYLGYAYKPYTTEAAPVKPTHLVSSTIGLVYAEPSVSDHPATRLSISTAVQVSETRGQFAKVSFPGTTVPSGWIATADLRPISSLPLKGESAAAQMIADAKKMTGVYYLWGGTTSYGIDCSGLCQLVHRLAGITIPRDADLQFAAGKKVDGDYQPGDLMFFGGEPAAHAPRKITHVGLSLGGWKIIHSSRSNNGVYIDDIQAVEHLKRDFAGSRTFIR